MRVESTPHELKYVAAALVAGIVLSGCSEAAPDRNSDAAPGVERCIEGPIRNSELNADDRGELPTLGRGTYEAGNRKPRRTAIGSLSLKRGKVILTADGLSPAHEDALKDATTDPFIGCILRDHVKGVDLLTTDNGADAGMYKNNLNDPADYDRIELVFTQTDDEAARVFEKKGAIRSALTHEGVHALYEDWENKMNEDDDPEGRMLFGELFDLHKRDLRLVLEEYRAEHGPETVTVLEHIRGKYQKEGSTAIAQSIQYVIDRYGEYGGLDELGMYCYNFSGQCESNSVQGMIWQAEEPAGVTIPRDAKSLDGFEDLETKLHDFLETSFPASDESSTLAGISGVKSGHPYDNPNELFASTINSDCMNPELVLAKLRALPPERRELAIWQRAAMLRLFEHFEPKLIQHLNTPDIVAKV